NAPSCSNFIRVVGIVIENPNITFRPDRLHSHPHPFNEFTVAVRKAENQLGEVSSSQAPAVVSGGYVERVRRFRLCVNATIEGIFHPRFRALSDFNLIGSNHFNRSYSLGANQLDGNAVAVVFLEKESETRFAFRWM